MMTTDVIFEITYTTAAGQKSSLELLDYDQAKRIARELAVASGHRTILPRKRIGWDIYWVRLEDGQWIKSTAGRRLSKREAAELFLRYNAKRHQVVCVPWPRWAQEPKAGA